jgi:hypothetical protein
VFLPEAVDLAVQAHIRHRHTSYDDYLMAGWDRDAARGAVENDVGQILAAWRNKRSHAATRESVSGS